MNRNNGIVAVTCSLCALIFTCIAITQIPPKPDRDAANFAELEEWFDQEFPLVHVANIPSPIMFPDESDPILSMLAEHDIMWSSGGSLSHSLSVSKNRVAEAQQLIRKKFPDIQLVPISESTQSPDPE